METQSKKWYASKTLWFNLLTLAVVVASGMGFAGFEPDPEVQVIGAGLVALINLVLRLVFTSQPVSLR
jgi:hypothetical protein